MYFWIYIFILLFIPGNDLSIEQKNMLNRVNELRAKGCHCGNRYMPPVRKLNWNEVLYTSAYRHAEDMYNRDYFSHYSLEGYDVGTRLDRIGYRWQIAGENLGEGQSNFDEVFRDWRGSPEHCRMLMEPRVEEMAIARYGKYWVQHFGKPLKNRLN